MPKRLIYDLRPLELEDYLLSIGQPAFRQSQIIDGLYKKLYQDLSQFTNVPNALKDRISQDFSLQPVSEIKRLVSEDHQTEKSLLKLHDNQRIETVLMRYEKRNSLCVSTQVGCPMDCAFCATGQMGFQRNLSVGEILGQIIFFIRRLREQGEILTSIVYMGMGEPFLNYDNTIASLEGLNHPDLLNFGARRVTVSTVGIIPKIEKFTKLNSQVNLAVSLHAPTDEVRSSIVPANRLYPIKPLMNTCKRYVEHTHRRITFEYALINQVNDSLDQAKQLAMLLQGMLCHVNLIALNPSKEYSLNGTHKSKVYAFQQCLLENGIQTTVRLRRGLEINAGCGQLASDEEGR
ncbi:MAG: 23S rRNA (adenine(2503)-C(2))-methyltransferase RlmN [Chloroflexi bacterium]|nr:23S rRNA (adenine(2503)-C(2))-methyltransferase RlmN [Chloroflexota bacterium]